MPDAEGRSTETELLAAARGGDRLAFEELYSRHKDRVYSFALYTTRAEDRARELTQEVFLRAFLRLDRFRGDSSFATWLHRMTLNLWIDQTRRHGRLRLASLDDAAARSLRGAEAADRSARRHEIGRAIYDAVSGLSDKLRHVFLLKYVAEMSYDEIARTLGCSVGTVGSRLHRCLSALSKELAPFKE